MELLLAVGITLCAVVILVLLSYNNQLHHRVETYKAMHGSALFEAHEWEGKYFSANQEASDLAVKLEDASHALDHAEDGEVLAPPSHGAKDIDVESVMAGSDDPVWDLVVDCRAVGVMGEWLGKNPAVEAQQPHRQYGEFATWILQLPEDQQTVKGITTAVRHG